MVLAQGIGRTLFGASLSPFLPSFPPPSLPSLLSILFSFFIIVVPCFLLCPLSFHNITGQLQGEVFVVEEMGFPVLEDRSVTLSVFPDLELFGLEGFKAAGRVGHLQSTASQPPALSASRCLPVSCSPVPPFGPLLRALPLVVPIC